MSGADSIADGRAFAWLDYDHDGLRDLVVTNANAPRVQLYRNALQTDANWMVLSLVGGQTDDRPSLEYSNRDAIGAILRVGLGDRVETVERRVGSGFAAQNSAQILLGMGSQTHVDWVEIRWPSGRIEHHEGPWTSRHRMSITEGSSPTIETLSVR